MNISQEQVFCDYLTISQTHKTSHIPFSSGITTVYDENNNIINQYSNWKSVQGKNQSNLQIRSDGTTVQVSGNISRFNRSENFVGLSLDESKKAVNCQLRKINLPLFTPGEFIDVNQGKKIIKIYTGATFSRIDMTSNIETGSQNNLQHYLEHIQLLEHSHLQKQITGKNTYFGQGAQTRTILAYDKALHLKQVVLPNTAESQKLYIEALSDFVQKKGVARIENKYKSKFLREKNIRAWHSATQKNLSTQYRGDIKFMTKKLIAKDFDEIPPNSLGALMSYMAGINVRKIYSKSTFNKHKLILQEFGYDISNKNISRIKPKTKTIVLSIAEVPDFYKYPEKPWELKSVS